MTYNKTNKMLFVIIVPILILTTSIYIYFNNLRFISTDDAYIKMAIIDISSQISGNIESVSVINNQIVKKGQEIFTIDPTLFLIKHKAAKANLDYTINQIESQKGEYRVKLANLQLALSDFTYAKKQYYRAQKLIASNSISQSDFDLIRKNYDNLSQNLITAQEFLNIARSNLGGDIDSPIETYPSYQIALSELENAKFDLDNTSIKAPCNGMVANFYLTTGTYVNSKIALFSIIDQNNIWIEANFKETQLRNVRPNQQATINIDTFSDKDYRAKVSDITAASGSEFSILPAQNTSGNWVKVTQRIMVRLNFDENIDLNLASGMSTQVTIDTKSK